MAAKVQLSPINSMLQPLFLVSCNNAWSVYMSTKSSFELYERLSNDFVNFSAFDNPKVSTESFPNYLIDTIHHG